jgi:hypothetical protein
VPQLFVFVWSPELLRETQFCVVIIYTYPNAQTTILHTSQWGRCPSSSITTMAYRCQYKLFGMSNPLVNILKNGVDLVSSSCWTDSFSAFYSMPICFSSTDSDLGWLVILLLRLNHLIVDSVQLFSLILINCMAYDQVSVQPYLRFRGFLSAAYIAVMYQNRIANY